MKSTPLRRVAAVSAVRLLLGCAVALWAFCQPAVAEDSEAGHTGKLFCPVEYSIALEYAGTIEEVLVAPGDKVRAGQALARYRLKDETVLEILTYLELQQAILNTQVEISKTEKEILSVKEEYEGARRLSAAQMGSAERLNRLKKTLDQLQRQKTLRTQGMEIDKKALQAKRAIVKRKLGKAVEGSDVPEYGELISPLAGEVLFVSPLLRKGMILNSLPVAVTVGQTDPMEVRTRVFESDVPGLRIGGKAKVTVLSLDNRAYDGVITSIDRRPEDTAVDRPSYYGVRVEVPNADGKLRAGFKTTVDFVPEKGAP